MVDNLTRWSVALLGGTLAFGGAIGTLLMSTADDRADSYHHAATVLTPGDTRLDATMRLDTYDRDAFVEYAQKAQDAKVPFANSCAGVNNVAHVCTVDIEAAKALDLIEAETEFYSSGHAVTTGTYRSNYADLVDGADTVIAATSRGAQPVTRESRDRYTLTRVQSAAAVEGGWFAQTLRALPAGSAWLASIAVGAFVTVGITLFTRPTTRRVETVGVEFFDAD